MFRPHSTFFGFLVAAAALSIAGIASAWSWNPAIYIFGTPVLFVLATRIFAGYSPVSFGSDAKRLAHEPSPADGDDGLDRYSEGLRPGMPVSNNQLLAQAYVEARQDGMTGEAMERFTKVATYVDKNERGDP